MSAGKFLRTKYQASYGSGSIHPIRIQPETAEAIMDNAPSADIVNAAPAGAVNNPISALNSLTRRAKGLRPRFITCAWKTGKPSNYADGGSIKIVCLTETFYNAANVGREINYLSGVLEVVSKDPERVS